MNKTYSVEIGRAVLGDNTITAEIGRFSADHEKEAQFYSGELFDIHFQNDEKGFCVSVYVNGEYTAVGKIQYDQDKKNIVIEKLENTNGKSSLQVGQIITLDSGDNNPSHVNIVYGDAVVARGKITKDLYNNEFYIMVTECA